jgi:type III pantothenate kinase
MNIQVDIGNSRIKRGIPLPSGGYEVGFLDVPPKGKGIDSDNFLRHLLRWETMFLFCEGVPPNEDTLTMDVHPTPITWLIAPTGSFPWQELKTEILKVRPRDKFKIVTQKKIPLKIDVDSPDKIGIDRLLAAFAAVKKYGDSPMLIVDAGSAITVDVVQSETFCGGAILPGITALSETYPKISKKLPLVALPDPFLTTRPVYPGKNTKNAIHNGLYWGTIGAIRQCYEMRFPRKDNARLILTGGDAQYLLPGLVQVIPSRRIRYNDDLVLEGIHRCFEE